MRVSPDIAPYGHPITGLPRWMSTTRLHGLMPGQPSQTLSSIETPFRNAFDHDIGILLHSSVFRRLSHKTQVYINPKNDFVRSRLTHSMECQQVGRELARRFSHLLLSNGWISAHIFPYFERPFESLVSAACIAHDMGHPPFGHSGAEELNRATKSSGLDFDDNRQTLRHFFRFDRPMNLTVALIDAVMKYKDPKVYGAKAPAWYSTDEALALQVTAQTDTQLNRHPACYLMEAADDISYLCGDIEDALKFGFISDEDLHDLVGQLPIVTFKPGLEDFEVSKKVFGQVYWPSADLPDAYAESRLRRSQSICSMLLKVMMAHVHQVLASFCEEVESTLSGLPKALSERKDFSQGILYTTCPRSDLGTTFLKLKLHFYKDLLLRNPNVKGERGQVQGVLEDLWGLLSPIADCSSASELGESLWADLPRDQKETLFNIVTTHAESSRRTTVLRYLCDYISGMTDRYALEMRELWKSASS